MFASRRLGGTVSRPRLGRKRCCQSYSKHGATMAASLHFIRSVELITIALMFVLSCSISLVAAWAILEAVFLLMMRSAVPELAESARLEALGRR
jgi:hypothetical protein